MENFVVSARKYRPSHFDSVIGQEHITQTLKNAIRSQQLAHAFLFCGPRGVGKTTCARILAKTINCQNLTPEIEACDQCDSCRTFNANASFNIYELDAASNNSVEDIRGLVEQVRYAPQGSKYKIYIIDEVHMLSSAAFNAFLKTLEEPPSYAKFILATTERHKILPTILSRCQVFDFHRIKAEHAVAQLKKICANEGITAEEEALHVIAQKADGAMRDALSIFDRIVSFSGKNITYQDVIQNLNILDYDYYFRAVDYFLNQDVPGSFLLFDEIINKGFDVSHFLSGLNEHLRNLSMCKFPNTHHLLEVATSVQQRYLEQSKRCGMSFILNGLNLINTCEQELRASKNPRLLIELYLMKLAYMQSVIDLNSEAADSKKKTPELSTAPVAEKPAPPPTPSPVETPEIASAPQVKNHATPPPPVLKQGQGGIQDRLNRIRQNVAVPPPATPEISTETVEEPISTDSDIPVQASTFSAAFEQYIQKLETEGKRSLSVTCKELKWELASPERVVLKLGSKLAEELLLDDRMHMIPFLRKQLNNRAFDIDTEVHSSYTYQKAFTAEDKFKLMAEKNPVLTELRNALGLEID